MKMKDGADKTTIRQEYNSELSKYIDCETALHRKFGWKHLVHLHWGAGDFGELIMDHPARHTLQCLMTKGAPVRISLDFA